MLKMMNTFFNVFNAWMCIPAVLAFAGNLAVAETTVPVDYGIVEAIEIFRTADNQPVNVGTLLGGLAGGVIGHQIGSGRGNSAATIAGAIGGAVVGTENQKKERHAARHGLTQR